MHLLESGWRRPPAGGSASASAAFHAAIIVAAALVGTRDLVRHVEVPGPERLIFSEPAAPAPAARVPAPSAPATAPPTGIVVPPVRLPSIPIPSLVADHVMPSTWPVPARQTGIADPGIGVTQPAVTRGHLHIRHSVDRAVRPSPANGAPVYPASLRSSGVIGDVLVRFVVAENGRVEEGSIDVVETTHPLFADAVRRWLLRNRYAPAELSGQPVRQLVEQRVEFTLE